MYAIITGGSISGYINYPKPITIGDVQYPAKIFSIWTASELAAIGIIEVTFDNSNRKDERWYINTDQTYTYDASAGTVTAVDYTQGGIYNFTSTGLIGLTTAGQAITCLLYTSDAADE